MNPTILRRVQKVLLTLGMVVTAMCLVLIVACFRNDAEIEKHKATVTADVVYADRLHANAYFQTPDGSVHSPRLGLLYPTELTAGQRIRVDYSTANPDLAKPTGRTAVLSIVPAVSVAVLGWIVVGALMLGVAEFSRRWGRRRAALRAARDEADAGSAGAQADGGARDEADAEGAGAQADGAARGEADAGSGAARGDDGAQRSGAQAEAEASSTGAESKSSAAETSRGVSRPDTSAEVAGNLGR
ncbi:MULTISPECIES: DUF3592 domain-containing protein [unclassified Gordonia (in: high G+C Gram-positive bacteria)]|uniref:DUF3592 domain-containing protein n=1 Tax=unclassified Gordonia (in: high G+C Gram-positive bacteria) TaxID=2657482 RepID=UPI0007EAC7F1|nr:hypothetical protein A5785_07385 [Gordonia sp. 852002-50395_SCH5434458]OBC16773.1 hypothetical protein A5786_02150 [Gordonia sp. 852002-50816_SCH5313054-a]OBC19658.1 hypothetical protein A5788_08705 [Gordonia sp. 852002-50816_SCH5313054-c]